MEILHESIRYRDSRIVVVQMKSAFFYWYYFCRSSSALPELFPIPYSSGRFPRYSNELYDFFVTDYVNSFFLRIAQLWNSILLEYFSLSNGLNGFISRVNIKLFKTNYSISLSPSPSCFLVTPCHVVTAHSCME